MTAVLRDQAMTFTGYGTNIDQARERAENAMNDHAWAPEDPGVELRETGRSYFLVTRLVPFTVCCVIRARP